MERGDGEERCSLNTKLVDNKLVTLVADHKTRVHNDDDDDATQNKASNALKKATKDDKENTQNVARALDSTILPLR